MSAPARTGQGLPDQAKDLIREIAQTMAAWDATQDAPRPALAEPFGQLLDLAPSETREALSTDLFRFAFYCQEHASAIRARQPGMAKEHARNMANAEQTLRRRLLAALNGKLAPDTPTPGGANHDH